LWSALALTAILCGCATLSAEEQRARAQRQADEERRYCAEGVYPPWLGVEGLKRAQAEDRDAAGWEAVAQAGHRSAELTTGVPAPINDSGPQNVAVQEFMLRRQVFRDDCNAARRNAGLPPIP